MLNFLVRLTGDLFIYLTFKYSRPGGEGKNNQNIPDLTAIYLRPTKTNQNLVG